MRKSSKEYTAIRKAKVEAMPKIPCACGCGTLITPLTSNYKPVRYVQGHHAKGNTIAKGKPAHNRIGDKPLTGAERQRRAVQKKRAAIELMAKIPCACGCGTMIAPITTEFKHAKYAHGHNGSGKETRFVKGQKPWNEGKPFPIASLIHKGKKLSDETLEKRAITRLSNNNGIWQIASGWKHTPETIENMKVANKKNAKFGSDNHFYGRHHTPESRKKMSIKLSGVNNPHWHGGSKRKDSGLFRRMQPIIRARDEFTCMRCGITQKELGRTINVHHLDHNPSNNSATNLVCACNKCNMWASYHREEEFINAEIAIRIWDRFLTLKS